VDVPEADGKTPRQTLAEDDLSGIWWIRWTDQSGRKRREKAGTFSAAKKLLAKRHTQKLEGTKLPVSQEIVFSRSEKTHTPDDT